MSVEGIAGRVKAVLATVPDGVAVVAAAKTRTPAEVREAVAAGVRVIGHNYVQEAAAMRRAFEAGVGGRGSEVRWHLIGHLQRNKATRAVGLFDMIETMDSMRLARAVDRHCGEIDKVMPVLIEINSGAELSKTGVTADEAAGLVREISNLTHVRVEGLMTMGPASGDPEDARPYFRLTKELFDRLAREGLPNVAMRHLSMGMSNSYRVAIEEGANVVRIGTGLFGPRGSGAPPAGV